MSRWSAVAVAVAVAVLVAAVAVARPAVAGVEAPDASMMKVMFPLMADEAALQCAREAPMPATMAVHLRGDEKSQITVTTKVTGRFARCFIKLMNQTHGQGPFDHPPQPFDLAIDLTFTPPQRQLESSLHTFIALGCQPRPGAIPTSASYDVAVNARGLSVQVTTTPDNAEVALCLDKKLRDWLKSFGAASWDLKAHSEQALQPPLNNEWLAHIVREKAPAVAAQCAPPAGRATHLDLRVHAHVDDAELAVDVKADRGDEAYRACVAAMLTPVLHDAVSVPRALSNGSAERYFRIVSDLDAVVSIEVSRPATP